MSALERLMHATRYNYHMKYTALFLFLLSPLTSFASASSTPGVLLMGDQEIAYDETETVSDGLLYYKDATLVASTHDTDGNETIDIWLQYNAEGEVTKEAYDMDGDGAADIQVGVAADGSVQLMGGAADEFQVPEAQPFTEPDEATVVDQDLVGDLSDIILEHPDRAWMFFIILLLAGGGMYFFWRRQA